MWFIITSSLLIIASILPFTNFSHWFFRIFEYGKIQIFTLQIILLLVSFITLKEHSLITIIFQFVTFVFIIIHSSSLYKFTPFYTIKQKKGSDNLSDYITIISANVYKDNNNYNRFIRLIKKYNPSIVLTLESDLKWQEAMNCLDKEYPFTVKVPLENTYGMHLYSKVEILEHKVHFFVADDLPSIEAKMKTIDGFEFTFFGVHPPPPSPTEEENSKERDGELLCVAKKIEKDIDTCIIVGDFNNVAWAKSSILFRKTSKTLDGRMGRGFISSYHAKYFFLRFPIDLIFHTSDVFINELKKLEYFGSDHFPIYSKFSISRNKLPQQANVENLDKEEEKNVDKLIEEGKNEESNERN